MADLDDRDWLDALGGEQAGPHTRLSTLKEASAVRQAMLTTRRLPPKLDIESGTRRLLERLRAENLLEEKGGRFAWIALGAVALAVVAIAAVIALREPGAPRRGEDIAVLAGGPAATQAIVSPRTDEVAEEIRGVMTRAGFSVRVIERDPVIRFEADWPRRPSKEQLEFLRRYGLARPSGPLLAIEVRPQ